MDPKAKTGRKGLALSGGGYRASLFHVGALWRLSEMGWLSKLDEITSVSGGSIAAAYLGLHWKDLKFNNRGVAENFVDVFVSPMRTMFSRTIDIPAILGGMANPIGSLAGRHDTRRIVDATLNGVAKYMPKGVIESTLKPMSQIISASADCAAQIWDELNPFPSPSQRLIKAYDQHLFHGATLQDLPDHKQPGNPRFTLYATNLQTGVSMRLSRDYMADYTLGKVEHPKVTLAEAVAASSGFPPFFTPVEIAMDVNEWRTFEGSEEPEFFHRKSLRKNLDLGDGAIYDNLGLQRLENLCEIILVSDAGDLLNVQERLPFDWLRQTLRATLITANQVNSLRKRTLIADFMREDEKYKKKGTYWNIGEEIDKLESVKPLLRDNSRTKELANTRLRLNHFNDGEQEDLIDWGYALADANMRCWVDKGAPPGNLPYPGRLQQGRRS